MREVALDTETTGLSPVQGDRLVEIGCVELINYLPTGKTFHKYINPERDVPEGARRVHGLSEEFLADKPKFKEIADEFLEFIGDSKLVIHNAKFDMGFINAELVRIKKPTLPMTRAIDTLQMARDKFKGARASLDALCKRFNISLESREDRHGALIDTELLAKVYLELKGGKQRTLLSGGGNEKKVSASNVSVKKVDRKKRDFPPSDEEVSEHNEFLKQINKPAWEQ